MSPADETDALLEEEALDYRSVHTYAVLGLLIGLISASVLFTSGADLNYTFALAPIPLAGLIASLIALRAINTSPELYTGKQLAQLGAVLSVFFLLTGVGYGTFVYATEVPAGYARTSFIEMKPDEDEVVNRELVPKDVLEYVQSGERVFIKGYIRPSSISFKQNLKEFLLVRDNNECCFGDISKVKYFDQVQVNLGPGLATDFNYGLFRVGGVLTVAPGNREAQTPLTYKLSADYVTP
ncbi:hypothetical protein MalM25_02510 [Planctomycetes bacterium MalM25]|nr:hypothetical protein MalM25_02510 [Planctomycetes bacterium MalM25]